MARRRKSRRFVRLRQRARQLWRQPSEGLEVRQLWSQFKSEASAGYGFYSRAVEHASFRTLAEAGTPLPELVELLNRATAARALGGRRFITAFLAELDRSSYALTSICAGHNAPILRRASGSIERLDAGGLPLGVDPEGDFTVVTTPLESGDALFVFTDGATDAVSPSGEVLGEPRLVEWIESLEKSPGAEMVTELMSRIDSFASMTHQRDDITLFLLQRP